MSKEKESAAVVSEQGERTFYNMDLGYKSEKIGEFLGTSSVQFLDELPAVRIRILINGKAKTIEVAGKDIATQLLVTARAAVDWSKVKSADETQFKAYKGKGKGKADKAVEKDDGVDW